MWRTPSVETARFVSRLIVAILAGVGAILAGGGAVAAAADAGSDPVSSVGPHGGEAATLAQEQPQVCDRSAEPLVGAFNGNIERVPKFLRTTVSDTEIHGVFHNDTNEDYTFVTDPDGTIQSYDVGRPESPSLRMITDCETFANISTADDPTSAFWSEYRNNEIRFVGVGLFNWVMIEALTHLPLLILLLVLALAYVGYRRYSVLSRGREGESGLRRTDAAESSSGEGGGASGGAGGETGGGGGSGGSGGSDDAR